MPALDVFRLSDPLRRHCLSVMQDFVVDFVLI